MITTTHLATVIDTIPSDSTLMDANAKEVLSNVQILARILKHTVSELHELSIDEIIFLINPAQVEVSTSPIDPGFTNLEKIEGTSTENIILGEGTIYFDIRFSVYYKEKAIKILLNIEAQKSAFSNTLNYHLENRIVYYLARMISSQKNVEFSHDNYDDIKKVYSIWICMDSKYDIGSIDEFRFTQKTTYGIPQSFPFLDKMHAIVISINPHRKPENSNNELICMLEDLFANIPVAEKKQILTQKYGLKMTTTLERSVSKMCNISEYFIEHATEVGLERGMKQGLEQGIKQGIEQGIEQSITIFIAALRKNNFSDASILNELMEGFQLSEETAMKYLQ